MSLDYRKMIALMKELDLGIIPWQLIRKSHDDNLDPFRGLDKKESRKLKRKFRKMKKRLKSKWPGKSWTNNKISEHIFWRLVRNEDWSIADEADEKSIRYTYDL